MQTEQEGGSECTTMLKKERKKKRKGKALWCGRIGPSCYSTVYEEPGIMRIWRTRQGAEGPKAQGRGGIGL